MRWRFGLAFAAFALAAQSSAAWAQSAPPQCATFGQLRTTAQEKAAAVREALQKKAERKEICVLITRFYAAEDAVVKFLENNRTWCGIPEAAITSAKAGHEQTLKYRTVACTEAPEAKPRAPSLSDAIGTPSVDTGANTKTGRGTLDSLTGNPLAR
jgi:hypothetical protein